MSSQRIAVVPMSTRPYGRLSGDELLPLIKSGDQVAIDEGALRKNSHVRQALVELANQATVVAATRVAVKAVKATGIGSRGGDVRWSLASHTTKGEGYQARKAAHDELAAMTTKEVRAFARTHGLVIAKGVTV